MPDLELDALIIGGGAAGLWLLDELHRRCYRALLVESRALGAGQTVASQGILHGGLKYMLGGTGSGSARAVGDMPALWRQCLLGESEPDLTGVIVQSPCCHLWRTQSLASRAGLAAARFVIRTEIHKTAAKDLPPALLECPGEVLRVEEQVIDVPSFLRVLGERHKERCLRVREEADPEFVTDGGRIRQVRVCLPGDSRSVSVHARAVIFTAGQGNERLRAVAGLAPGAMQRRPLHMVMVRGALPALFGHCVDANKTRVTITTATDLRGRTVWQVGGEIAERGVDEPAPRLIDFARRELRAVLPGVDFGDTEWATYRIQRAEGKDPGGRRPETIVWRKEGTFITAWPTKLVLVPRLAKEITDTLGSPGPGGPTFSVPCDWPRPTVALPPWETSDAWNR